MPLNVVSYFGSAERANTPIQWISFFFFASACLPASISIVEAFLSCCRQQFIMYTFSNNFLCALLSYGLVGAPEPPKTVFSVICSIFFHSLSLSNAINGIADEEHSFFSITYSLNFSILFSPCSCSICCHYALLLFRGTNVRNRISQWGNSHSLHSKHFFPSLCSFNFAWRWISFWFCNGFFFRSLSLVLTLSSSLSLFLPPLHYLRLFSFTPLIHIFLAVLAMSADILFLCIIGLVWDIY